MWVKEIRIGAVSRLSCTLPKYTTLRPYRARSLSMVSSKRRCLSVSNEAIVSAINIPLDVIVAAMPVRMPDRNQVLLLHCQSGMRSGVAVKKLKSLGYTNAFNLGSLSRARAIVDGVEGE